MSVQLQLPSTLDVITYVSSMLDCVMPKTIAKTKWTLIPMYNSWYAKYMKFDAVVIYPFVLFNDDITELKPSFIKHEMTHVKQIEELGYCEFFKDYFAELNANGYLNNKYEVEAFTNEHLPLTDEELARLCLPHDFPKTDKEKKRREKRQKTTNTKGKRVNVKR